MGLHFGEAGIRLVLLRIAPSSANADRLAELIVANAQDEHRELMWGSAGTMLVAAELHRSTGGRFTLWTGDPGVALYLADCLAGGGELPMP